MDAAETLLQTITDQYGLPNIKYLGVRSWKIWVYGWHVAPLPESETCGWLTAEGETIEEAARKLLAIDESRPVVRAGHCRQAHTNQVH